MYLLNTFILTKSVNKGTGEKKLKKYLKFKSFLLIFIQEKLEQISEKLFVVFSSKITRVKYILTILYIL